MEDIEREVNQFIETHSEEWLISAIVDGSVGYYSPDWAKKLIEDWKNGVRKCCSERCMALYGCDLGRMLLSDFHSFETLEQFAPNSAKKVMVKVKAWMDIDRDVVGNMTLSLMYPTL